MITTITTAISSALHSIGSYFNWKSSAVSQRRETEKDVAAKEAETQATVAQIKEAVYSANDARLNEIVTNLLAPVVSLLFALHSSLSTLHSSLSTLHSSLSTLHFLSPVLTVALCATALVGCSTPAPAVVYIPTDRRIETVTNSIGIACKAVPDAVFVELLERSQELKDLKTEIKVNSRLSK